MAAHVELSTGTLSAWDDERGFGFIVPVDTPRRVFVHISAFGSRIRRPVVGDTLTFRTERAPDGRPRAAAVRYSGASAVSGRRTRAASGRVGSYIVVLAFAALFFTVSVVWEPPSKFCATRPSRRASAQASG